MRSPLRLSDMNRQKPVDMCFVSSLRSTRSDFKLIVDPLRDEASSITTKCGGNLGNSLEKAKKKAKLSIGFTIFINHYFIVYLMVFSLELLGVRISSAIKSNEATASDASTEQVVEAKSTLLEASLEDGNAMIPDQAQDEPVRAEAQGDSSLVSSKDMQNTEDHDHMVPTPESSHALQIELKRTEDMFDFVTRLFLTEKEGHAQTRLMLSDMTARYEALSKLLEEHLQAAKSQEEREKPHQQLIEQPSSDLDSSHIELHANETLTNETLEVPTTEDLPPAHIVDGDNSEAQEVDSCEAQPTLTSPDSQAQGNEERDVIEEEPREDEAPPEREEVEPTDSVPIQEQPEIECDSIHPAPDLEAANKNHSEEEHPEGSSDESIILEEPPSKDFDIRHVKTDNVLIKTESEHLHYLVMDGKEVAKIENTLNIWTIESMKVQGYTLLCQREVVHCDVLTSHTAYIIVDEKRKERGRVNMGRVEWTEGINYKFRKVIARGGYAIIVEGWQSDRVYAIKLDRSGISMDMSKTEVSRAGVISTKEVFSIRDITEKEDDIMVSVMERADCTLDHFIRERSSTFRIQQVMQQLAEAVQGIHKGKVIHLDLRSSNVLMVRGKPKIADWGLARYIFEEWIYAGSGTTTYSAPEILLREDEGKASEVYSLACIFYEILLGVTMEEIPERTMRQEKTFNDAIQESLKKVNDYGMILLLGRMMSRQPRSRPSIDSVVDKLEELRGNTK
ncbi:serine/threonine protein kinase [Planoprotostelium fungivorum]|uniref:Serine/threonine protein kinase n=1 Tax=Planoprotostelium fungivorum TaxID=1890364 RepID=A0A2P6NKW6_9EUKA|nr:serine/threonine protein kinase [Planoprotostelium fungivorum]